MRRGEVEVLEGGERRRGVRRGGIPYLPEVFTRVLHGALCCYEADNLSGRVYLHLHRQVHRQRVKPRHELTA